MKSYTDIEQSKKLADILPLESADMEYLSIKETGKLVGNIPFVKDDSEVEDSAYSHTYDRIACWSLAALLDVLPKHIKDYNVLRTDIGEKDFSLWYDEVGYGVNDRLPDITMVCPVDACVEMIEKLNELNLL
jgi:hypothetical protein